MSSEKETLLVGVERQDVGFYFVLFCFQYDTGM